MISCVGMRGRGWFGAVVVCMVASNATAQPYAPFTEEAEARGLVYEVQRYPQPQGHLGFGCGFADLDGDGDQDVIVLGALTGRVGLFENDGTGHFTDRTMGSGMPILTEASALGIGDYDGDGRVDIYLTQLGEPNYLMRNVADFTFTDVTAAAMVQDLGAGEAATWGDYDGDRWLDLYVCNYNGFAAGTEDFDNKLFRNRGDGTFEDVSVAQGVDDDGYGFQSVWFDYDQDGDVDLYLSNDRGHLPPLFRPNQLWRNDDGNLVNVSAGSGADLGFFSMGVACGDFDGNLKPDLYCTNIGGYVDGFNPLFMNQGTTFIESSALAGVDQYITSWGAIFFDFDNDRRQDLYVNNMFQGNTFYKEEVGYPCVELAADLGIQGATVHSFGSAVADVDGDGDIDLMQNNLGDNVELFINQEGDQQNWVRLKIVGLPPNHHAIGARVFVQDAGVTTYHEILAGGNNYLGQNELIVHAGLGPAATAVDQITVHWPGNETTRTLTTLHSDEHWTIYPSARLGDADGDGAVTIDDFAVMAACYPGRLEPGCEMMDFNGDSLLTSSDASVFIDRYTDPLQDCNDNGTPDLLEILEGTVADMNGDAIPDTCLSPVDLNGDGWVDTDDLLALINAWGDCPATPAACPADINNSGAVDTDDLLALINAWSPPPDTP